MFLLSLLTGIVSARLPKRRSTATATKTHRVCLKANTPAAPLNNNEGDRHLIEWVPVPDHSR